MTPNEVKLTTVAIAASSYARYLHLIVNNQLKDLEADDERDFKRLSQWWNALGVERKEKIERWIKEFSKETEDVTPITSKQLIQTNFQWEPGQ